ncbi:hypothetical protein HK097_006768, partial [Rhizophlyctis rosea]
TAPQQPPPHPIPAEIRANTTQNARADDTPVQVVVAGAVEVVPDDHIIILMMIVPFSTRSRNYEKIT